MPDPLLKYGDQGAAVRELQRLINSAAIVPRIDEHGYFGDQTYVAVITLQQQQGLVADGCVNEQTWEVLRQAGTASTPRLSDPALLAYFVREEPIAPLPSGTASGHLLLVYGDQGLLVRELQALLNVSGTTPPLAEDGVFGERTYYALVFFQRQCGLPDDGRVDERTWSALLRWSPALAARSRRLPPSDTTRKPHLKLGDKNSAVKVLQLLLNVRGAHPLVREDGQFGAATEAAVRSFQQTHQLPVTGEVDMTTWERLLQDVTWYPVYRSPQPTAVSLPDLCQSYQPDRFPNQTRALLWLQSQLPETTLTRFVHIWQSYAQPS
ncbi:peptidoglycan-binding domain-containing protein [Trichothermofontia sp.]